MKKILLIDDNFFDNIDCIKHLKTWYKVDAVSSIKSARDKLRKSVDYDIIVLDIMMPSDGLLDMDETLNGLITGLIFYEKELAGLKMPVIFWSLASDFEEEIRNKNWTNTYFFSKDMDEDHLLNAVNNIIAKNS